MGNVNFSPASSFFVVAKKVFNEQKDKIIRVLPYADVQHIGGTSIPNSITKGDLDLVIRVPKNKFKQAIKELTRMYQINQPDIWNDLYASFKDKNNLDIDVDAQLVVMNSKSDDFVKTRDLLRERPELLEELNSLKIKYEGKNMTDYRKSKEKFYQKIKELLD